MLTDKYLGRSWFTERLNDSEPYYIGEFGEVLDWRHTSSGDTIVYTTRNYYIRCVLEGVFVAFYMSNEKAWVEACRLPQFTNIRTHVSFCFFGAF